MKIIAAVLAALLATCAGAEAQRSRPREVSPSYYYLYGEYNYYTDSSDLSGGGAGLGWNINRYLGLQAGGQLLSASGVDVTNVYAEAKLSWPLTDSFSVYASAGGAYGDASASVTLLTFPPRTVKVSKSATGYRIGLGAEYWLSENWGLRANWHQQNVGGVGSDIGAGIAFRF